MGAARAGPGFRPVAGRSHRWSPNARESTVTNGHTWSIPGPLACANGRVWARMDRAGRACGGVQIPPPPPLPLQAGRRRVTVDAAVRYDPYDYAVHEDPYPTYARLRDEAPVYRNDERDFWALSRHADVMAGFQDARLSSAYGVSIDPLAWGPQAASTMSFLAMDPPKHSLMRALVSRGFTARRVLDLEPRIRELATGYVDAAVDRGSFEFVGDLAGRLPMDVISELIGVPPADRDELRRVADLLVHREAGVLDVPTTGMEAAVALVEYYVNLLADRRASPRDDLTSAL